METTRPSFCITRSSVLFQVREQLLEEDKSEYTSKSAIMSQKRPRSPPLDQAMAPNPHHLTIHALFLLASIATAAPFPAPDLTLCGAAYNTTEECCILPHSLAGKPIKKFTLDHAHLPLRHRRAAHLLDATYTAKYQRAVARMRALPDTDGRSWTAQWRLHCAYCNNHLYYPSHQFPLEIHNSWFFFPWHRLFLFFHERILASLIGDDTFALPFWNWDSQNEREPLPNALPWMYFYNASIGDEREVSALWDADRNTCSAPPELPEFQDFVGCDHPRPDPGVTRVKNAHVMWTQMVSVGVTPLAMLGGVYRFGDFGGRGPGAITARPHANMHGWTNLHDMGAFRTAALDPAFYGLHGNIDRLWDLWKTLPGRYRGEVTDRDYLDTEFAFFDEEGEQVSASIKDFLDLTKIRVKYEEVSNAWVEKGAPQVDGDPAWEFCAANTSPAAVSHVIRRAPRFKAPMYVMQGPLTFKVKRQPDMDDSDGEEMLELKIAEFTWHKRHALNVFAYLPTAQYENTSVGCHEYLGHFGHFPHPGLSPDLNYEMVFRIGIRRKLEMMGRAHLKQLVVTLVGQSYVSPTNPGETGVNITSAEVIYSKE